MIGNQYYTSIYKEPTQFVSGVRESKDQLPSLLGLFVLVGVAAPVESLLFPLPLLLPVPGNFACK